MIACCDAVREQEMVYVDGQGNIVRPRRRIPGLWMVCALVATAAVMVQTVPSLAELKDHRARADGLWLSPTVEWHVSLGVASIARCDSIHLGAFGRWLSLSDLVPKQLRPRLEAIAADDAQLLLAIVAAVFIAHVLLPGWRFLRHFAASAEALRAGRYWSLVLAAFAHEDLMHVGFNALALSRAAPALQGRLKHDRTMFWSFVVLAAVASSLASVFGRSTTGYTETKGASGIVFAMLAHAAATNPAAPMFVYGMEMPAATALVAMLAVDVLVRSSRGIDYACHAGGALFGLAFYEYCKLY